MWFFPLGTSSCLLHSFIASAFLLYQKDFIPIIRTFESFLFLLIIPDEFLFKPPSSMLLPALWLWLLQLVISALWFPNLFLQCIPLLGGTWSLHASFGELPSFPILVLIRGLGIFTKRFCMVALLCSSFISCSFLMNFFLYPHHQTQQLLSYGYWCTLTLSWFNLPYIPF